MSCEKKIYTREGLKSELQCCGTTIAKAVARDGELFNLKGKMVKRVRHISCSQKWGYVIMGDATEPPPEPPPRKHRAKPREGHCAGCDAKVGKYRAIKLNGNTVCQTCHRDAFVHHDVDMRRALGVV